MAFNLAVPTFFALTVSHAFGLGYALASEGAAEKPAAGARSPLARAGLWGGVAAVVLVAVMGNLTGVVQLVDLFGRVGGATFSDGGVHLQDIQRVAAGLVSVVTGREPLPAFDYWYRGTRVIPHTINEFPFFSFLFADLHPHMIAIPFTVAALALFWAMLKPQDEGDSARVLRWGVVAVVIGALGAINTWDLPAYWGLLGCVMLYRGLGARRGPGVLPSLAGVLVLVLTSLLLYAPFYMHYRAQHVGLDSVPPGERSPLGPFLMIWGFFIFLAIALLAHWLVDALSSARLERLVRRFGWGRVLRRLWALNPAGVAVRAAAVLALAASPGGAVLWVRQGSAVLGLLTPLVVAAGAALLLSDGRPQAFLQRLLLFAGLAILMGIEVFYLKDFLSGSEWRRMNTVFKFGIQAWVLLGVAAGSALPELWNALPGAGSRLALVPWLAAFWLLLLSSLVYTVLAVPARVNERFDNAPRRETLDGTAYMTVARYSWPNPEHEIEMAFDREAIAWLWEHVEGTPVIAEAPLGYYREGGLRVSSYTGLPTLLGAHEREQRPWEMVGERERVAQAVYTYSVHETRDLMALLDRYGVRYVYVGQLERIEYGGPGIDKFPRLVEQSLLKCVYHNDRVDIYQVVAGADGR
ncbi:MAG: hypothetical protein FJZ90_14915, partial [Chloroflexi bacterium]|nr:hypothetical protein [Chloroflexota bacterium]